MKTMHLRVRYCDCCGSDNLEELWRYSTKARTKNHTWDWDVRNVVCRNCGFAFVSPCPEEGFLEEYYEDSYEYYRGQKPDYSIKNRCGLISKYAPRKASYVEIGSNESTRFVTQLSKIVGRITTIEPNSSCKSTYNSIHSIRGKDADIVTAYFVLEHISNPKEFLGLCAECLKENGILILEVPNLYLYPADPAGLSWWEHTNHFSPHTLSSLAGSQGFRLIEVSQRYCSRPFGFAAVFARNSKKTNHDNQNHTEYLISRYCINEGLELIKDYYRRINDVRHRIELVVKDNKPSDVSVILWGANRICKDLLDGWHTGESAVIVDSNPEKRDYFSPLIVHQPEAVFDIIANAKVLVINTALNSKEILEFIKLATGREFEQEHVLIVE